MRDAFTAPSGGGLPAWRSPADVGSSAGSVPVGGGTFGTAERRGSGGVVDDVGATTVYRIPADSAEFWINLKALAPYARSDMCPPFSPGRRTLLNRLIRAHWADLVFERVPWQVREHLGIELDDWVMQHPDSGRTSRVVIPFQRSRSGAEAEDRLFNRFPKTNRRRGER